MAIHIHLSALLRKPSKDAGFSRQEYDPREYNRLTDEIKETEKRIKELKARRTVPPFQLQDELRILEKLKAERAKYRTDK